MEILESISWIILGFVPTLCVLETFDGLSKRRKKLVTEPKVAPAQIAG